MAESIEQNDLGLEEQVLSMYSSVTDYDNISEENNQPIYGEDYINKEKLSYVDKHFALPENESLANYLLFDLPDWGVEDYIADRDKWIKGKRSIADEPGWFYFKVFFKFNTNFGLFGGMLDDTKLMQSNCALRYLNTIKTLYRSEQIPMRINALSKFTSILSQINTKYPWMIKGVGGLNKVMNTYISNFDNTEKNIELTFNTETTDMKIINMLNYYKLACYDDINCKEIIPENLRKFDMMIVFYHIPIKYFQTAIMVAPKRDLTTGIMKPGSKLAKAEEVINKTFNFLTTKSTYYKYKRMMPENNDYSNMMSFNMFTFNNCEFDVNSFGNYFDGSDMKNDTAFQFNETKINIKYERVYYHTMNEWSQTFFGSDGFYYDPNFPSGSTLPGNRVNKIRDTKSNSFSNRLKSLKEARAGSTFFDKNAEQYKSLIDFSESIITNGLMNMSMKNYYSFIKGNLYGNIGIGSDYFDAKMNLLSSGSNGAISGNIYGIESNKYRTSYGVEEDSYFTKKIEALKKGTVLGNIYGTKLYINNNQSDSSKKILDPYFEQKQLALKEGTISGNIYSNVEGKDEYFKSKMNLLSREPGVVSGNLYANESIMQNYFDLKLKALKYGTFVSTSNTKDLISNKDGLKNITDVNHKNKTYWENDIEYKTIKSDIINYRNRLFEREININEERKQSVEKLKNSLEDTLNIDEEKKQALEKLKNSLEDTLNIDEQRKQSIETIRNSLEPYLHIDQKKKQSVDIVQYLSGTLGDLNEQSLTSGIKNTINNAKSFFSMSKNDW